jgi:hypothetical protein
MSDALTERGRALEDMFFAARDQERVAALRARAELEGAAASLSQQTLVEDEAVLHRVVGLGVTVETLAAFSVVPLLYVAWGDRVLDPAERDAIVAEAVAAGIETGSAAHDLLQSWLTRSPNPELFEAWRAFHAELAPHLSERERGALKEDILSKAARVARASGGFLGFGSVSAAEQAALRQLETLLG